NYRDITEQVEARQKLEKANTELTNVFNNIDEVIYSARRNPYQIVQWSEACNKVYGYSSEEFIQAGFLWYELILPEDKHMIDELNDMLLTGKVSTVQYRIRHKDGSVRWIEARVSPTLNERGDITRVDGVNRDITDKKLAEQALEDSERKFRTLIEKSKDGIALADREGIIRYVSPAITSVLGYEPAELIGQTAAIFRQPSATPDEPLDKSKIAPGCSITRVMLARHKDGSSRWVEITVTNQFDNPAVGAMVTNFRDVTEQKLADELVQHSEKRFRALIENNKEGIALSDSERRFIYLSPSVKDILGYTPEEMIGATALDLYHPDDKAKVRDLVQLIMDRQQLHGSIHIRLLHKDGRYRWMELVLSHQFDDPAVQAMVTNFRDITDRINVEEALVHSEQRFKYLIEKNQDVIAMSGGDGAITYMSPAVKEVLGYQPEELLGTSAMELMHPDELPANIGHLTWCNENPGKAMFMVLRLRHKDGSWRWMEASSISHLDSPGVNAIVSNLRDITERKRIQDELFELNRSLEEKVKERTGQLEESNRALESFSSLAAHDLQSPLRVLTGYVGLLKREYQQELPTDAHTLLDVIVKQTGRMKQLITDLLAFSRASHAALNREPADLTHIVQEKVDEQLMALTGQPMPEIVLHDLGTSNCDAGLLREVWANLVSNAIKYSNKSEKPRVEIGVCDSGEGTAYYISDNGVGFDMKAAEKMFQLFQRMHNSSDFEGTGLGLALVKNIVNKHGGRIWAESAPGQGATFLFTLPEASLDHA
ncbi:MAG: PAS domain S-box protein, partial [Bacteroidetes bacterium]|nr:PAS domain S-box protein [Bacteroidota bacterium]